MNLFILDRIPKVTAQYHFCSHIRSGIIESISVMGFAFSEGEFEPWKFINRKNKHYNHPICRWVRQNRENFNWTLDYCGALLDEYTYRTNKIHKSRETFNWILNNLPLKNLPEGRQTDWPRCFVGCDVEITDDAVRDYRDYYRRFKMHLFQYTKRPKPDWL